MELKKSNDFNSSGFSEISGNKTTKKQSRTRQNTVRRQGISVERVFTEKGVDPYSLVEWTKRTAQIVGSDGTIYFEQKNCEVPAGWSQMATNVVAQKYFRGTLETPERENSIKHMIGRVSDTITAWGRENGYFKSSQDADNFNDELTYLLLFQKMAFNSPVWFNVGVEDAPQCSACFINSVEDSMDSILELATTEGMLFKYGSGTGSNLSTIRSSKENLQGGGNASGPISFMRGYDAFAGAIKSGGKTRRAAKMVILDASHPDVNMFIGCKADEEKKAWALIDAGYDGSFNVPGGAYDTVGFQNANHSVRVTDEFMNNVCNGEPWSTRRRVDNEIVETFPAQQMLRDMAEAAHVCGDPGIQFDTTINEWHTCSNTAPINASNPCSEYMFLDDSACNLASLNLRTFQDEHGEFLIEEFNEAVRTTTIAMEIIVGNARYPTRRIQDNSIRFRPLGLGYANMGALLMSRGLAYDSDEGRAYAAAITAIMCGQSYATSATISRDATGPFDGYPENEHPFLNVMQKHRNAVDDIQTEFVPETMMDAARSTWDDALSLGKKNGYRNAQATVLAPTGTIGFLMDCDTTGVEPDIALVKYKNLVGGGMLKIINKTVPEALSRLGYTDDHVASICSYIEKQGTIEGAEHLKDKHLDVFDCAFRAERGVRSIDTMGHIKMMEAVQPFLSGAISKTVNMPSDCTVEDIENAYMEAWKRGLKAIAVYRDGCKRTQPLSTSTDPSIDHLSTEERTAIENIRAAKKHQGGAPEPIRHKLPAERQSITHKFKISGHDGYMIVGLYDNKMPGELFICMAKEGSTIGGLMDCFATSISIALQHGVPLSLLCEKFKGTRFEPSGYTETKDIRFATSIMDYIFRWLSERFLPKNTESFDTNGAQLELPTGEVPSVKQATVKQTTEVVESSKGDVWVSELDAPPCHSCGSLMIRSGACHRCLVCGSTSGCS